jgi:hypothetical protein
MSAITDVERQIILGKLKGTPEEKKAAIKKLEKFQKEKSNPMYVMAVNSLIPAADMVAKGQARKGADYSLAFHKYMNAKTRSAGLRA